MTAGAAQILNASTTAAGASDEVKVRAGEIVTFMLTDNLLATATTEDIKIQYRDPSGNWLDLYQDGSAVVLTDVISMLSVIGPGTFRANKSQTSASATGVGIARGNSSL